jgi:hypothetical protein
MFKLRFEVNAIEFWSIRFGGSETEARILNEIAPRAKKKGYLDKQDFLTICEWNSSRPRALYRSNPEDDVREVTRVSFSTKHEKLRIQILTLLKGVSIPTGSVLLHFCAPAPYPILDSNSLWSVQATRPRAYDFEFWWEYVKYTRKLAQQARVSMRVLDRALYQYAVENSA